MIRGLSSSNNKFLIHDRMFRVAVAFPLTRAGSGEAGEAGRGRRRWAARARPRLCLGFIRYASADSAEITVTLDLDGTIATRLL